MRFLSRHRRADESLLNGSFCFNPLFPREILDVFIIVTFILHFFSRCQQFFSSNSLWEVIKHSTLYANIITHFINFVKLLQIVLRWRVWDRSVGVRCQKLYKQQHFIKHKNDLICPRVISHCSVRLSASSPPRILHMDFRFQFEFFTSQFTINFLLRCCSHTVWSKKECESERQSVVESWI